MRIQKIQSARVIGTKKLSITKPKISFRADKTEKPEDKKLSFAQKRAILAGLKGLEITNRYKAMFLPDREFERFVDFYENYEKDSSFAFQYSRLDERQDKLYNFLRKKSVSPKYALKATGYNNKQLDRYAKIFGDFTPEYMADKAVNLEDKKFDRLVKLLDEDNSFTASFDVAELEDDEYERAIELNAKGFKLIFVDDVAKDAQLCAILNKAIDDKIDMRILNVAFKRTAKFEEIKQSVKKQKPEEVFVKIALYNASESVLDYFDDNIKNTKEADFLVKNKNGKISTQVIEKFGNKIQCEYSYDKKGKIENATYTSSAKPPLEVRFSFQNGHLKKLVYARNELEINLDVKSPEFISLFDTKYGVETLVNVLLRAESARNLVDEDYEALNKIVFGEKKQEVIDAICEFEKEFPNTKLLVDNAMPVEYIERLKEILKTQPTREIPKKIFITSFMPFNTSGEFGHSNKIAVAPVQDIDFFDISVYHEIQHMKDYVSGIKYGQGRSGNALLYGKEIASDIHGQILKDKIMLLEGKMVISDSELKKLITRQVSDYATTNCAEFIAEFGAMMRKGIIGVKIENGEINYSINKSHKNTHLENCVINKEEFARLIKFYLMMGGTPEINNNFTGNDEVITISQKEALEVEFEKSFN